MTSSWRTGRRRANGLGGAGVGVGVGMVKQTLDADGCGGGPGLVPCERIAIYPYPDTSSAAG